MTIAPWIAAVAFVAFALFALANVAALILVPLLASRRLYPQKVPGYGIRMRGCPYDPKLVAQVLDDLIVEWREAFPAHSVRQCKACFKGDTIEWALGTKVDGVRQRWIVDRWGRRVAGVRGEQGDLVVYLETDTIGATAFVHERLHDLDTMNGLARNHSDPRIWGSQTDGYIPDDPNYPSEGIVQRVKWKYLDKDGQQAELFTAAKKGAPVGDPNA